MSIYFVFIRGNVKVLACFGGFTWLWRGLLVEGGFGFAGRSGASSVAVINAMTRCMLVSLLGFSLSLFLICQSCSLDFGPSL